MLYNLLFFTEFIFIINEEMFDGWHPQLIKVIVLYSAIRSQFRFMKCVPCQDHLFPVVSCQCPGQGLVAAPAAGPITSQDHVYISWPPQHLVTWSLQFRTHSQTSAIQDNMELPDLKLNNEEQRRKVLDFLSPLYIDESKCQKVISVFQNELDKGNITHTPSK